jgi:hypothetical protein
VRLYCSSHSAVNKMTAKASLQQLLSYVFTRMEQCDRRLKEDAAAAAAAAAATEPIAAETDTTDTADGSAFAADSAADTAEQSNGDDTTAAADRENPITSTPNRARHSRQSSVATVEEAAVQPLQCPDSMYAAVFEQQQFATLYSLSAAAADTASSGSSATADSIAEFEDAADEIDPHERLEQKCGAFPSLLHRDAFLLFRALCKLSMKAEGGADDSSSSGGVAAAAAPDSAATEARQVRLLLLSLCAHLSVLCYMCSSVVLQHGNR